MYGQQLEQGEHYSSLTRCVAISILDIELFDHTPDLHSVFRFYDKEHEHRLSDVLEIHYIELTKFKLKKPQELKTHLQKWLYLLKFGEGFALGHEPIPPELTEEEGISMAINVMRKAYATDEVREEMELRLKALRDFNSRVAQERAEGKAEGKAEAQLELARKLKAKGMDAATIEELSGVDASRL